MIAGLPKVGTDEKKLPDRFRSVRFSNWNISSGNYSRLFAAKSSYFRFLQLYKLRMLSKLNLL